MNKMLDIDAIDDYFAKQNQSKKTKKEDTLSANDHLESVLFQFINLYERWAEDRQVAAKQGSDIAKLVKDFSREVTRFESLDDSLREKIKECVHTEAKNMAIYMGKTVADAAGKDAELIAKQLRKSVKEAEDTLSQYQRETYREKWMWIGVTMLTSITASLFAVWLLMPEPMLPLTKDQLETYQSGQVFEMVIHKLSKRQQDLIFDIARGKEKNPEQLFDKQKKK